MSFSLEELSDREEIRQVLSTYTRAINRKDQELLATLFHNDGEDDHGTFSGSATDFPRWAIEYMERSFDFTAQCTGSVVIEIDGDQARTESFATVVHVIKPEGDEDRKFDALFCRYLDTFEKRRGEWKILKRELAMDWRFRGPLGSMESFPES
jgi:hypothetical protein